MAWVLDPILAVAGALAVLAVGRHLRRRIGDPDPEATRTLGPIREGRGVVIAVGAAAVAASLVLLRLATLAGGKPPTAASPLPASQPPVRSPIPVPTAPSRLQPGLPHVPSATLGAVLLVTALVLLLVVVAAVRRRHAPDYDEHPRSLDDQLAAALEPALESAVVPAGQLDAQDPRAVVLSSYSRLEAHLNEPARLHMPGSDSAAEILDRAVTAGLVTGGPARRLVALFEEARFSAHPIGVAEAVEAQTCLARLRDDLRRRV